MGLTPADSEFRRAVDLFNAGEFYACHDVLEELWSQTLGPERQFLQGLIHAAVSLFHFEGGNLGGARKMADSTRNYLTPYCPNYFNINVERFLAEYARCFQDLFRAGPEYPVGVHLDTTRIPRILISGEDGQSVRGGSLPDR